MAIFRVTPATSVFADFGSYAFTSDSPGADTLIVDPGAFVIGGRNSFGGAFLANTGAWTVTVNGSIFSDNGGTGLVLLQDNTAVSTITIGAEGEVGGGTGIAAGSAATIKNAGVITGSYFGIDLFNGDVHTITNSGTIDGVLYSIRGGIGIDKVTNSGTINGVVELNGGNDVFTNYVTDASGTRPGTVNSVIGMGSGNDKFFGGSNAEIVHDDAGSDIVKLGDGNDTYNAICNPLGDGTDVVDGGIGIDTYNASKATSWVAINLDTVAHDLSPISGNGDVAARTALGDAIAGAFKDVITGFENALGGSAGDILYGNAAANLLDGGGSGDNLLGYGGDDTLLGGDGADGLAGGAGKDTLVGGSAGDFFQYFATTDSGVTSATRDVITDFQDGVDKIDLFFIDANTTNGAATNDAFTFIGTNVAFGGTPGQLRAYWTGSGQIISGDVNGDKVADFSIGVIDSTHSLNFAGDFLL